jgi:hypothetical protein
MGNENEKKMIEITNMKTSGSLKLGFKDKNGNSIDFVYGMTISEKDVDKDILESSLKSGLLYAYLYKGWVVKGKVNVNNKIIGTPVKIEKIENKEEINKIEAKVNNNKNILNDRLNTQEPKVIKVEDIPMDKDNNIVVNNVNNVVVESTNVVAESKKRGRPKKEVKIESEIKNVNNEIKEIKNENNNDNEVGITDSPNTTINGTITNNKEDEDFL